jgi:hypothetical protein
MTASLHVSVYDSGFKPCLNSSTESCQTDKKVWQDPVDPWYVECHFISVQSSACSSPLNYQSNALHILFGRYLNSLLHLHDSNHVFWLPPNTDFHPVFHNLKHSLPHKLVHKTSRPLFCTIQGYYTQEVFVTYFTNETGIVDIYSEI